MLPMTTPRRALAVLACALALGALGDYRIRARLWGVNVTRGVVAVAGSALALRRGRQPEPDENRSVWPWLAAGFFAAMWAVRDAEMLFAAGPLGGPGPPS